MPLSGFTSFPLSGTGDTILNYDVLRQLWDGTRRRAWAIGSLNWPPTNIAWDSGTVSNVSQGAGNALTVTMPTTAAWGSANTCTEFRFVDYTCTTCSLNFLPVVYDYVIITDEDDPRTQMRGRITAQVNATTVGDNGTLTIDGTFILNAITAGWIDGLSDLNGKPYVILKAGSGLWSADRFPDPPPATATEVQWLSNGGTSGLGYWPADDTTDPVTGVVTHHGPQYVTVEDPNPLTSWTEDKWTESQVMIYASGLLRRVTPIHNSDNTLYFVNNGDTAGIGGAFWIVEDGATCFPGRPYWFPWQWYTGRGDNAVGHTVYDTLAGFPVPAHNYKYSSGNPCNINGECDDNYSVGCFRIDAQIATDELCSTGQADDYINPNLYKSILGLQDYIESIVGYFVPHSFDNSSDNVTPYGYTLATWFTDMNHPGGTGSTQYYSYTVTNEDGTTSDAGYYFFSVSSDFATTPVYWTIIKDDGSNGPSGYSTPDTNGRITNVLDGAPPDSGSDPNAGLNVIYAAGWYRFRPRWVKYHYEKSMFMPSVGSLTPDGEPQVIDPPQVTMNDDGTYDGSLTGTWITRGKSTGNISVGEDGYVADSVEPFVVNRRYRFIGDNARDPFPGGSLEPPAGLLTPYEDKFYRGNLSTPNQGQLEAQRSGKVTSGNYYSLTQADNNWWSDWCNGGGALRSESGTATAGTATSLTDHVKDTTNHYLVHGCWWAADRFATGFDPYVGFVLEVDQTRTLPDPDPSHIAANPHATVSQTVTFKVPITSTSQGVNGIVVNFEAFQIPKYNATTLTWTWEGFSVKEHDAYRIPEPKYQRNKFRGCKVFVTTPDGTALAPIVVQYSDSDTLYFDAQSQPIPKDSKFIIEVLGAGVYIWNGTDMVATGSTPETRHDTTRLSVKSAADFLDDPNYNNEDWVADYGSFRYGDMICVELLNDIHDGLKLLDWTVGGMGWTSRANPATPEKNQAAINCPPVQFAKDGSVSYTLIDGTTYHPTDPDSANEVCWKQGHEIVYTAPDGTEYYPGGMKSEAASLSPAKYASFEVGMLFDGSWASPETNHGQMSLAVMSRYAYPTTTVPAGAAKLGCTIDVYGYGEIALGDPPDQDATTTYQESEPTDHWYQASQQVRESKFDGGSSGCEYHKWTSVTSFSVSAGATPGDTLIGPKVGDIDDDTPPQIIDPEAPPSPKSDYYENNSFGGNSSTQGYTGYYIGNTAGIIKWDMQGF